MTFDPYTSPVDYTPLPIDDLTMLRRQVSIAIVTMKANGLRADKMHINPAWWITLCENTTRKTGMNTDGLQRKVKQERGAGWNGLELIWDEKLPHGRTMVLQSHVIYRLEE